MKLPFLALVLGFALGAIAQYAYMREDCSDRLDSLFQLERELDELAPEVPQHEPYKPAPQPTRRVIT